MRWRFVLHVVGAIIGFVGLSMVLAVPFAVYYGEGDTRALATSALISIGAGLALYLLAGIGLDKRAMNHREGMAITALGWFAAGLFGALPFWLDGTFVLPVDCVFESLSGFSTTGASVLTNIEEVPKGILFWRSLTHWLGGMGIIVLSLAILPFLGVGGMQLYKAEVPGPVPDKLTPRIKDTAAVLWKVYVGFSVAEAVLLMLGGMNFFDACCHTFGTMATGGFSTRNASIAAYGPYIQYVITGFMLLAGVNFSLHFRLLTGKPMAMLRDPEFKAFMGIFAVSVLVCLLSTYRVNYQSLEEAFRHGSFQVASILTTTGYATADYEIWPFLPQLLLLTLMFIGGSAGSTGGGMKVMRMVLLAKHGYRELLRLIHPRGVYHVKFGGKAVPDDVMSGIWGFFLLWLALFVAGALLVAATGVDVLTAISASVACIGNIGPGLGMVGPTDNYMFMPEPAKWVLILLMVLGRLELFTVLVLFVPEFWRR